jgi:hypothetical protein
LSAEALEWKNKKDTVDSGKKLLKKLIQVLQIKTTSKKIRLIKENPEFPKNILNLLK